MQIIQTNRFKKAVKKLNPQQKSELDQAVKTIAETPSIGERKKGDLDFLQVYKFRMNNQLTLLAYSYEEEIITLTLLDVGSHENFYRDIKHSI